MHGNTTDLTQWFLSVSFFLIPLIIRTTTLLLTLNHEIHHTTINYSTISHKKQ